MEVVIITLFVLCFPTFEIWGNYGETNTPKSTHIYTKLLFHQTQANLLFMGNSPIYGEFGEIDFVTPLGLYVGL